MGAHYVLLAQLYLLSLTRSNRPGEEDIRMGAKATRTRRPPAPCGHPWHAPHQRVRYSLAGVPGKAPHDARKQGPRLPGARERDSERDVGLRDRPTSVAGWQPPGLPQFAEVLVQPDS